MYQYSDKSQTFAQSEIQPIDKNAYLEMVWMIHPNYLEYQELFTEYCSIDQDVVGVNFPNIRESCEFSTFVTQSNQRGSEHHTLLTYF